MTLFPANKTYKKPDKDTLYHDLHFWLGLETTQDEAGTAAYKTVELDDFLGTSPVQHREVQGHESHLFLSYFKVFTVLEGGTPTGFKHVEARAPTGPRLLHIFTIPSSVPRLPNRRPLSTLMVKQVPAVFESLNAGDVFVLDRGNEILQWNGSESAGLEKNKAAEYVRKLDDERKDAKVVVFDQTDSDAAKFYESLGGKKGDVATAAEGTARSAAAAGPIGTDRSLHRLSDSTGSLQFTEAARGVVKREQLRTDDVFVFDCGFEVFVWVGKGASGEERKKAMGYAVEYIKAHNRPLHLPVTRLLEGAENQVFLDAFDA
ncbi:hypothetical protein HKX48_000213 [Thoreauomyces humboldtii]|nr:hypothetical protein HKX48_000213 [Thoreauomyces humboldtii]